MTKNSMQICLDNQTLTVFSDGSFTITIDDTEWQFEGGSILTDDTTLSFGEMAQPKIERMETGIATGIRIRYTNCEPLSFELRLLLQKEGQLLAEWIPLSKQTKNIRQVCWPGSAIFDQTDSRWYSLLTLQQGLMIPNGWPVSFEKLPFNGQLESAAAYMPWFGQVKENDGYIAICQTPADAGYSCLHPAGGGTRLAFYWLPVLGKMTGVRKVRYSFRQDCDYTQLAKIYRQYARETGLLRTLSEKAAANPKVDSLIGAGFVHTGIKTHVDPKSDFFDPAAPEKNNHLTPFSVRAKEITRFHQLGVDRLYLHLDGWGQPGYDNCHPDYLPACQEAGGWHGLRGLQQTVHNCGYLYGLHDQYRDFYHSAPSYDPALSVQAPDGSIFSMALWAGGPQDYLCASQAPHFVRRNFDKLFAEDIRPDCSYLDVFTCNEPDECANPAHPMTRSECLDYRLSCFAWLNANGILPSSEEAADWSIPQLVFCHYAPYSFMMERPGSPRKGIPVPLYNLVYHDCLIIPWPMENHPDGEDYMLYALLNGGAAYIRRDPAYPGMDGAFSITAGDQTEEDVRRWRIVSELQRKVAKMEMVSHRLLDKQGNQQQTVFSDGKRRITVQINLPEKSWNIQEELL